MPDTVVYVSNASKESISSHERGELTLLDKVLVPGTDKPSPTSMPMAVTPDHRFLCAALRSDPFPVSSFAIDPASGVDGKITGKTVFCSKRHHGACATVFRTAISIRKSLSSRRSSGEIP